MLWFILALMVAAGAIGSVFFKRLPPKVGNAICAALTLVLIVFAIVSPETRRHNLFFAFFGLSLLAQRIAAQRRSGKVQSLP